MSLCGKLLGSFRRPLLYSVVRAKGHSKWQNIKATKTKVDQQRSQVINFLLQKVRRAVKKNGFDPKFNKDLSNIQSEFRERSLPLDTFNNFLVKIKERPESTVYFDVIGPAGSFFILETETDSKSRMQQTVTKYFNKVGGFRYSTGQAVRQAFEEKGLIHVNLMKDGKLIPMETMEEVGIELDCEDVGLVTDETGEHYELLFDYINLRKAEKQLTAMGYTVELAELQMRAKHTVQLSPEDSSKVERFYAFLQDDENVKQIFDNLEPEVELNPES